jgi:hypothetical protein
VSWLTFRGRYALDECPALSAKYNSGTINPLIALWCPAFLAGLKDNEALIVLDGQSCVPSLDNRHVPPKVALISSYNEAYIAGAA